MVTLNTAGSSFDTLLAVYLGSQVNQLTPIAANDETGAVQTSALSFYAIANTTYAIVVDGYEGQAGNVFLNLAYTSSYDLYFTDFESFTIGANNVDARDGWSVSPETSGISGIKLGIAPSKIAYLGSGPMTAGYAYLWRPILYNPVAAGTPVVRFTVDLAIVDSTNSRYDIFSFDLYNLKGELLGSVEFDNSDLRIYRWDGMNFHDVGAFQNGVKYALTVTINFATNTWSAQLGGTALFLNQTLNTQARALALGDITMTWVVATPGSPGSNSLEFDNFRFAVVPQNIPPTISDIASQTVNEDTATNTLAFTVGDLETAVGSLSLTRGSSNTSLVPMENIILGGTAANRTVIVTPAPNQNGTATITITVSDGTLMANKTFLVTVNPVNDPPSFSKDADQTVFEDAGAQTVIAWATAISAGPANEAAQAMDFIVTNNNNSLFSAQPAIAANGSLTYTPAANASGTATVKAKIHDNGGTTNGGVDTSAEQTFTVTVNAVNDPPVFTKGPNQSVAANAGSQTVANWASGIGAGASNESAQSLSFVVTNNNNGLFSAQPAISASGTLTYAPALGAGGNAVVTVQLRDNGGTANGGNDASGVQMFTITVNVPVTATASHSVVGNGYTPGSVLTIANTLTYTGTPLSLGWTVVLPLGLSFVTDGGNVGSTKPSVGATGLLDWSWPTIPASPITFTYSVNVPAGQNGVLPLVAQVQAVGQAGSTITVVAQRDPLGIQTAGGHTADTDHDLRISLSEVTRVIELYNTRLGDNRTGRYRVLSGTEDGFAADTTSTSNQSLVSYHAADTNFSGSLDFTELLRVIQLYNYRTGTVRTGRYHFQATGTEDGFAVGLPP